MEQISGEKIFWNNALKLDILIFNFSPFYPFYLISSYVTTPWDLSNAIFVVVVNILEYANYFLGLYPVKLW